MKKTEYLLSKLINNYNLERIDDKWVFNKVELNH